MTPDTDGEVASALRSFFSRLPDEILVQTLKHHRANHIQGVLVLNYHDFAIPGSSGLAACEVHWTEDEELKTYTEPVVNPIGMEVVRKVLGIRFVDKRFARCMLEAFFKSPVVFQHGSSRDLAIKPIWFLPCQVEPELVKRGTSIKVDYRDDWRRRLGGAVLNHKAGIECARTAMNLDLSKAMHLPTINDDDEKLLDSYPNGVFIEAPNGLLIRGIQFTGGYERTSIFLPKRRSEKAIQMFFNLLQHPDWHSNDAAPGSPFILSLQ